MAIHKSFSIFAGIGVFLSAVVVSLWICEGILWLMGYNPLLYYAGMPNHQYHHKTFEFNVAYEQNEFGFRTPNVSFEKPRNTYRIVILGDSYTYGLGVEDAEVYARQLEVRFNTFFKSTSSPRRVQVINLGISNRAIGDYLAFYQSVGIRYQPDLTIVSFFEGNDVSDEVSEVLPTGEVLDETSVYAFIRNSLQGISPRLFKLIKITKKQWKHKALTEFRAVLPWPEDKLVQYLMASGIDSAYAVKRIKEIPDAMREDALANRIYRPAFARWCAGQQANIVLPDTLTMRRNEKFTAETFGRLVDLARHNHSDIMLAAIPSPFAVVQKEKLVWAVSSPPETVQEQIRNLVIRMCKENQTAYIDLKPALKAADQAGETTHFAYDLHWTARGHRLVADTLFERIKDRVIN